MGYALYPHRQLWSEARNDRIQIYTSFRIIKHMSNTLLTLQDKIRTSTLTGGDLLPLTPVVVLTACCLLQ